MKMRVVTRHLTKEVLIATGFVLFALVALFAFFDIVGQLKRIGRDYSIWMALWFAVLNLPTRIYEVMPIAALLACVYTLSRWASTSEFTILRVSGLSPLRLVAMLCVPAAFLAVVTYALGEFIAPVADRYWLSTRTQVLDRTLTAKGFSSGVWVKDVQHDKNGNVQNVRFVNVRNLVAGQDSHTGAWRVFEFDAKNDLRRLVSASSADFIPPRGWNLKNATVQRLPSITKDERPMIEKASRQKNRQVFLTSEITPAILGVLTIKPESMGIQDLYSYIDHLKENKQTTKRYEVAMWSKVFYPLAIFVMLVVGMPFAYLNARSGGVSIKIFVGLMIGIGFYMLNNVFAYLGAMHTWSPVLAAVFPSCVMLVLAAATMYLVERR